MSKSVMTAYGMVDASALEALQEDFAATRLLTDAVDAVERISDRIGGLRADLLDPRTMASDVIDDDPDGTRPDREESIGEMAEMLASELFEYIEGLGKAYEMLERVATLIPDDDNDEAPTDDAAGRGGR